MANQVNDRAFDLMTTAADKTAVDLFPPKKEEASTKNIHNGTGRKIEETNMIKNIIKHKTEKSRKLFEDMMKAEKTLKKFGIDINDF